MTESNSTTTSDDKTLMYFSLDPGRLPCVRSPGPCVTVPINSTQTFLLTLPTLLLDVRSRLSCAPLLFFPFGVVGPRQVTPDT